MGRINEKWKEGRMEGPTEREGGEREIKRLWEWKKGREINKKRGRRRKERGCGARVWVAQVLERPPSHHLQC